MLSFPGVPGVGRRQDWTPRRQDRGRKAARLTAVNLLSSGATEAQRRKDTHSPAPSSNVEEFKGSMEHGGRLGSTHERNKPGAKQDRLGVRSLEVDKRVQAFGKCLGESVSQIRGARQLTGITRGYVGTMERAYLVQQGQGPAPCKNSQERQKASLPESWGPTWPAHAETSLGFQRQEADPDWI